VVWSTTTFLFRVMTIVSRVRGYLLSLTHHLTRPTPFKPFFLSLVRACALRPQNAPSGFLWLFFFFWSIAALPSFFDDLISSPILVSRLTDQRSLRRKYLDLHWPPLDTFLDLMQGPPIFKLHRIAGFYRFSCSSPMPWLHVLFFSILGPILASRTPSLRISMTDNVRF